MPFSEPKALHDAFSAAIAAHDADTLVNMYDANFVQLQRDGSISSDRDALRVMFEELFAQGPMPEVAQRVTLTTGDLALTSTTYSFPTPAGGTFSMTTAEVSRRQADGDWMVMIDAPYFVTSES